MFLAAPWKYAFWVISWITISKALREDLIPNGFLHPFRCFKAVDFLEVRHSKVETAISCQHFLCIRKYAFITIEYFGSVISYEMESVGKAAEGCRCFNHPIIVILG